MSEFRASSSQAPRRAFLGVKYVTCGAYGRLYKNRAETAYVGHCPRCAHYYQIRIGAGGTADRFFEITCPSR